jgi:hypothetical protein
MRTGRGRFTYQEAVSAKALISAWLVNSTRQVSLIDRGLPSLPIPIRHISGTHMAPDDIGALPNTTVPGVRWDRALSDPVVSGLVVSIQSVPTVVTSDRQGVSGCRAWMLHTMMLSLAPVPLAQGPAGVPENKPWNFDNSMVKPAGPPVAGLSPGPRRSTCRLSKLATPCSTNGALNGYRPFPLLPPILAPAITAGDIRLSMDPGTRRLVVANGGQPGPRPGAIATSVIRFLRPVSMARGGAADSSDRGRCRPSQDPLGDRRYGP